MVFVPGTHRRYEHAGIAEVAGHGAASRSLAAAAKTACPFRGTATTTEPRRSSDTSIGTGSISISPSRTRNRTRAPGIKWLASRTALGTTSRWRRLAVTGRPWKRVWAGGSSAARPGSGNGSTGRARTGRTWKLGCGETRPRWRPGFWRRFSRGRTRKTLKPEHGWWLRGDLHQTDFHQTRHLFRPRSACRSSDLRRIEWMGDEDIDYSDIPELDASFFANRTRGGPPGQEAGDRPSGQRCVGVDEGPGQGIPNPDQRHFAGVLRGAYEPLTLPEVEAVSPERWPRSWRPTTSPAARPGSAEDTTIIDSELCPHVFSCPDLWHG